MKFEHQPFFFFFYVGNTFCLSLVWKLGEKESFLSLLQGNGYLYLQITHRAHSPSRVEQSYNFDQIRDELEDESVKDSEEALDIDYGDLLEFRYFILFNETFSSPCLYFNCQYIGERIDFPLKID